MACENLSKYYLISYEIFRVRHAPLYEDTSAIDFGSDRSVRLAVQGPKVGHKELDCSVCVRRTESYRVLQVRVVQQLVVWFSQNGTVIRKWDTP